MRRWCSLVVSVLVMLVMSMVTAHSAMAREVRAFGPQIHATVTSPVLISAAYSTNPEIKVELKGFYNEQSVTGEVLGAMKYTRSLEGQLEMSTAELARSNLRRLPALTSYLGAAGEGLTNLRW